MCVQTAHRAALTGLSPKGFHYTLTVCGRMKKITASWGQPQADTICDYWFAQPWNGKWQKIYSICGLYIVERVPVYSVLIITSDSLFSLCDISVCTLCTASFTKPLLNFLLILDLVTLFFFEHLSLTLCVCVFLRGEVGISSMTTVKMDWRQTVFTWFTPI